MKAVKYLLSLSLVAILASGSLAGDDEKKKGEKPAAKKADAKKGDKAPAKKGAKKGARGKGRKPRSVVGQFLKNIELTEDQKKQVAALDKELAPKFAELQKQNASVLTEDQRKAQREILAAAKAGKTERSEVRKKLAEAVTLSDEQKAKQAEIRKAMGQLRQDALAKVSSILTDEQKAKLPKRGKRPAGGKKPGAKKPGAKKPGAKKTDAKKDGEKKPSKDAA